MESLTFHNGKWSLSWLTRTRGFPSEATISLLRIFNSQKLRERSGQSSPDFSVKTRLPLHYLLQCNCFDLCSVYAPKNTNCILTEPYFDNSIYKHRGVSIVLFALTAESSGSRQRRPRYPFVRFKCYLPAVVEVAANNNKMSRVILSFHQQALFCIFFISVEILLLLFTCRRVVVVLYVHAVDRLRSLALCSPTLVAVGDKYKAAAYVQRPLQYGMKDCIHRLKGRWRKTAQNMTKWVDNKLYLPNFNPKSYWPVVVGGLKKTSIGPQLVNSDCASSDTNWEQPFNIPKGRVVIKVVFQVIKRAFLQCVFAE